MTNTKTLRLAVLAAACAAAAHAGTSLSGIKIFSTDATGRDQGIGSQVWTTQPGGGPSKLWVVRGNLDDPFVNGPSSTASAIDIPLTNGTQTFNIYAAPGEERPYFGMNLFFNGVGATPRISVYAPPRGSAGQPAPAFQPDGSMTQVLAASTLVAGSRSVTFQDGAVTVKLTAYSFCMPGVFTRDRAGRQVTGADGTMDFIGQFTLEVTGAVRTPLISQGGVVNGASFGPQIAPGSLIAIFGSEMAGGQTSASSVPLPAALLNTSVTIAGKPMPVNYVSATQINAQLPYNAPMGLQPVVVHSDGADSPPMMVTVSAVAPGIFQFGTNRAVVQNEDYSVNQADNPAKAGSYVIAYLTGAGIPDNPVPNGTPAKADPLSRVNAQVTVTIGGHVATQVFAGLTPGFVGLTQVNLQIPDLAPGTYPLVVSLNAVASNSALITVK
jgi:uncharacterized protein (TIGR03437 family)